MTLNLIYTIEVTMFILLKLSRICYFRVEKSERLTVILIIIRSNCNKSLAITFWVISLKTRIYTFHFFSLDLVPVILYEKSSNYLIIKWAGIK